MQVKNWKNALGDWMIQRAGNGIQYVLPPDHQAESILDNEQKPFPFDGCSR